MRAEVENYKGIEFVRISSLPETQKSVFWQSFDKSKIIKILRTDSLLNDCVQYHDYTEWVSKHFKQEPISNPVPVVISVRQPVLKLA
jgi:hypothetical protein